MVMSGDAFVLTLSRPSSSVTEFPTISDDRFTVQKGLKQQNRFDVDP